MKKIKCKSCAAEFMPTMAKSACPGCGAEPDGDEVVMHASALAALPEISSDGALPADIQVFPPGRGIRFTLQDYPGEEFEMDSDAAVAAKANADLQNLLARARSQQGPKPFADKNHEDAEATFHPLEFFWGGDDPVAGGVRVKTNWTPFGAQLVRAKAFHYFSGNFLFSRAKKKFVGLINENVGGLVNRPGFATQAAFARGDASRTPLTNNQKTHMTDQEIQSAITAGLTAGLKPVADRLDALEAKAKAGASTDNTDLTTAITAAIKPVTDKLAALDAQHQDTLKASAKATVAKYIGRVGLAPQDTKAIEFYEKAMLADPAATEEILAKLPARAAASRIILGQGATETGTEPQFSEPENKVLKAAAKAAAERKLPDTAAGLEAYLHTTEGQAAYREILAGRDPGRKDLR